MPPDEQIRLRKSEEALALWRRLAGLYDEIEGALRDLRPGTDIGRLGREIVEVETELRPLVAEIGEYRAAVRHVSPPLRELWAEADGVIANLAERQPSLTRAAIAARDGASTALARLRSVRRDSVAYRQPPGSGRSPQFASRQA